MSNIMDRHLKALVKHKGLHADDVDICQVAKELLRARKALRFYANPKSWREDDWGVPSIICGPDYGNPGYIAKCALPLSELRPK